jgi:hypothetical protein
MKKILATLAGTTALVLGLGACSAVDTQETKSIAPIADSVNPPVLQKNFDRFDYYNRPNRSATRPVKPAISAHEAHVNHLKQVAAAKAAKDAAKAKARAERLAKLKAIKLAKYKAWKAKQEQQKKAVVKKKTPVKRVGLSGIAACIAKYESGGNPRAENPHSSASGLFQFIDGTWRAVTGRSDRAKDAPVSVQIAAFYELWDGGRGAHHWVVAPKCGY